MVEKDSDYSGSSLTRQSLQRRSSNCTPSISQPSAYEENNISYNESRLWHLVLSILLEGSVGSHESQSPNHKHERLWKTLISHRQILSKEASWNTKEQPGLTPVSEKKDPLKKNGSFRVIRDAAGESWCVHWHRLEDFETASSSEDNEKAAMSPGSCSTDSSSEESNFWETPSRGRLTAQESATPLTPLSSSHGSKTRSREGSPLEHLSRSRRIRIPVSPRSRTASSSARDQQSEITSKQAGTNTDSALLDRDLHTLPSTAVETNDSRNESSPSISNTYRFSEPNERPYVINPTENSHRNIAANLTASSRGHETLDQTITSTTTSTRQIATTSDQEQASTAPAENIKTENVVTERTRIQPLATPATLANRLGIDEVDTEIFKCAGITQKSQRCTARLSKMTKENIKRDLGELAKLLNRHDQNYSDSAKLLKALSQMVHCKRFHQDQAEAKLRVWRQRPLHPFYGSGEEKVETATSQTVVVEETTSDPRNIIFKETTTIISNTTNLRRTSEPDYNFLRHNVVEAEIRNLTPYNVKKPKTVADHAKNQLTTQEREDGFVYVYWVPGNFGLVKIGWTRKEVDYRLNEWRKDCGHVPIRIFPQEYEAKKIPHAKRVENMIHTELYKWRRREEMCKGRRCGSHIEWFEVSNEVAVEVAEKWTEWMMKEPYDQDGNLKKNGPALPQLRETPVNREQSLRPSSHHRASRTPSPASRNGQEQRRSARLAAKKEREQSKSPMPFWDTTLFKTKGED